MKILDLQTGSIHEYGTNPHDSLYVSNDGRFLTYYNLQNGDGSGVGDYRFVCDDDKVPCESETADAIHAEVYFNIGGFERTDKEELALQYQRGYTDGFLEAKRKYEQKPVTPPSCLTNPERRDELLERYKEGGEP